MGRIYNKFIVQIYDEKPNIPGLGDGPFIDPPIVISEEHFRTLKALEYNIIKIGELLVVEEIRDNPKIENYSINRIELSRELQGELDSYKKEIDRLKNAISNFKVKLPKISDRNTWLLYNYNLGCYIDSGVKCNGEQVQPIGIKKLEIDNNHHLIVTLTDDAIQDAGAFPNNLPIKGIDYWTEQDKQDINDYIINNLDLSEYGFITSNELEELLTNYITNTEFEEYKEEILKPVFIKVINNEENLESLDERVTKLENDVEDLQTTTNNLNNRIDSININNTEIINRINSNTDKINNIKSDINNIRDSVNENYESIQNINNNIDEVNNNIDEVNNNIDTINNNLSDLTDNVNNNIVTINVIQDQVSENTNNIKLINEKLKKIDTLNEEYIEDRIKIDSISLNDIELIPDENKNINIEINIPTNISEFENDAGYITTNYLIDNNYIHNNIDILNSITQEDIDYWNDKSDINNIKNRIDNIENNLIWQEL